MTTIDAHQHFWRYSAAEYGWIDDSMARAAARLPAGGARREMTRAGVDACVAVQARQTLEETRWLLELADAHPFIAGVVGWVDLQSPDVAAELDRVGAAPEAGRRPPHRAGEAGRSLPAAAGVSAAASRCSKRSAWPTTS